MKLLVITQAVDLTDPILGFFHGWLEEFAKRYSQLTVICLKHGRSALPANVRILSLGKEAGQSKLKYLWRFYTYLWREKKNYDTVFVHMNQEYVLLAGWWWRLTGKKIWLWRNHPLGGWWTRLAVLLADRVFCTSRQSFTAQFKKTEIMPAGINTEHFGQSNCARIGSDSVMYVGRFSAIKKVSLLLEALELLETRKIKFSADLYGGSGDHFNYRGVAAFHPPVPNFKMPMVYNSHQILVNLTPTGSFDKVVLEMMATGGLVLVSNQSFAELWSPLESKLFVFKEDDTQDLALKLEALLCLSASEKERLGALGRETVIQNHSLKKLAEKIMK